MLPRDPDAREELFYAAQLRIIELLEQLVKPETPKTTVTTPVNKTQTNQGGKQNEHSHKPKNTATRKPSSRRSSNNTK